MAILRDDRKNYIINGAFDFFQRAVSNSGSGSLASNYETYVGPDRFSVVRIGLGAAGDEFQRSSAVPNDNFRYSLNASRGVSSASDSLYIAQKIESDNAKELAGKTCSVSFWCYAGTNVDQMTLRLGYPANIDDYPGTTTFATVDLSSQIVNDSWVLYKAENISVDVLSSRGIQVRIQFENTTGTGDIGMNITGVILNEGDVCSPFKTAGKNTAEELSFCQRYYEKSYNIGVSEGATTSTRGAFAGYKADLNNPGATRFYLNIDFLSRKRATPTVSFWGHRSTYASNTINRYNANENISVNTSNTLVAEIGVRGYLDASPTSLQDSAYLTHWAADAEL